MTLISRSIIASLALTLAATTALAQEAAPQQAPVPVQEDGQSIETLRSQAAGHHDASVKVNTETYNDGALPNNATTTTNTTVTKPRNVAAQGAPVDTPADPTEFTPTTDPESQLVYMSGGIGASETEFFKQLKEDYTFKLLMADKEGHLVSDVTVTIADAKDKKVATLTEVGPYLVVKLPAGKYKVTASLNGVDVVRNVTIKAGKQTAVDARF